MDQKPTIIETLNRVLYVEYALIWHYPRLVERIADKEAARIFIGLGKISVRHAEETTKLIRIFGGEPVLNISDPPEGDIVTILRQMLEMEKLANWLYSQAADLTDDTRAKELLLRQAKEEAGHTDIVERLLMRIFKGGAAGELA